MTNKCFFLLFYLSCFISPDSYAAQDYSEADCNQSTKNELMIVRKDLLSAYSEQSQKQVASNLIIHLQRVIQIVDIYKQYDDKNCQKKLSLQLDALKKESEGYIKFLVTMYYPDSENSSTDTEYVNRLSNLSSKKITDYWAHHIESMSMVFLKLRRTRI